FTALSSEDFAAGRQIVNGRFAKSVLILERRRPRRARTDVVRRAREVLPQDGLVAAHDSRNGVELAPVPVGIVQAFDWARVVEKRIGIPNLVLKLEGVDDVRPGVTVVVDENLIQDVVAKLI